jgi:spore coat protein SA
MSTAAQFAPVGPAKISTMRSGSRISVGVLLSGKEKFSPFYGGAVARWTYEVYKRLSENVDVSVFGFPTQSEHRYPLSHHASGYSLACEFVSHIPFARRYEDWFWLRTLTGRLAACDVLHIHNRPQWVDLLRRMGYSGNVLLHLHNDHVGHWTSTALDELAKQLDGVLVCSKYLLSTFAGKSQALVAKTSVISNGVDLKTFCRHPSIREPKTIFFVGRFEEEKGVLQLIRAFGMVLRSHPDARLIVGGATGFGVHRETAYVRRARNEAEEINYRGGSIQFLGYLHHDRDLPSWFQLATVLVCPSLFQEPFGMVNVEAMACATPVIASRRGGIPEVLGNCGILIEPENVKELADSLIWLLDRPHERIRLGEAGYQRCQELFGWEVVSADFLHLLQNQRAVHIFKT